MQTLLVVIVSTLAGMAVAAESAMLTGKAVSVHDGDTLHVVDAGGVNHTVRLQGIDAPETKQPFGTKARNRLAKDCHKFVHRTVTACGPLRQEGLTGTGGGEHNPPLVWYPLRHSNRERLMRSLIVVTLVAVVAGQSLTACA